MNRRQRIIRNMIILAIFIFLVLPRMGLYLNPLSAHEASERSIHYGPSKVVHVEGFKGGKYYLCKYDKWFSCDTIKRTYVFLWGFGNQSIGTENNTSKALNFSCGMAEEKTLVYGVINNHKISTVEATFEIGERLAKKTIKQTKFYEDMFIIVLPFNGTDYPNLKSIRGYDINRNLVFSENI